MLDDILRYSEEIDKLVPRAVEESLKVKVKNIKKLTHGEVNYVYKVETDNRTVVIRVFRRKYWPNIKRVKYIEELLKDIHGVHPETLFLTSDSSIFENGFMITEYIEGKNGQEAIEQKNISFEEFHRQLFKKLKRIYEIPIVGFGHLNPEDETYDDFLSFRIGQLHDRFNDLETIPEYDEVYLTQIEDVFKKLIEPLNSRIKPVIVHGDATPANTIYTSNAEIIILDWDNASANTFMRDISLLTYWGSHVTSEGEKSIRNEILWKLLLEEFGNIGFTEKELKTLERINHIGISLDNLPYYLLDQKNQEAYELVKKRLTELVEGD